MVSILCRSWPPRHTVTTLLTNTKPYNAMITMTTLNNVTMITFMMLPDCQHHTERQSMNTQNINIKLITSSHQSWHCCSFRIGRRGRFECSCVCTDYTISQPYYCLSITETRARAGESWLAAKHTVNDNIDVILDWKWHLIKQQLLPESPLDILSVHFNLSLDHLLAPLRNISPPVRSCHISLRPISDLLCFLFGKD